MTLNVFFKMQSHSRSGTQVLLLPLGFKPRAAKAAGRDKACSATRQLVEHHTQPSLVPPMRTLMESQVTRKNLWEPQAPDEGYKTPSTSSGTCPSSYIPVWAFGPLPCSNLIPALPQCLPLPCLDFQALIFCLL